MVQYHQKIFLATLTKKKLTSNHLISILHSAIKKVGIYSINIKLHAEVTCDLKINVATSPENANEQKNELNKSNKPNEDIKDEESKVSVDDEINASEKKL